MCSDIWYNTLSHIYIGKAWSDVLFAAQKVNIHYKFILIAILESFFFDGSLPQLLVKPM